MRVLHVRRSLRAAWLAALFVAAALVAPSVARGDVDLSNDWFVHFSSVKSFDCDLTFVQSGSALTANGDCRGSSPSATFTGTVDPQSGAFSLSGSIWTGAPFPYLYIVFAGAPSGDGSVLNGTATVDGSPGTFTASLCGNGNLDANEACDDGSLTGGCCTSSCTPRPDGIACTTTEDCQVAPTCAAGACVGAPKPAGTLCEADGNGCTDDACDGAGTCAAGPCSPCCGGPSCTPAPRYGTCKRPTDGRNLVDLQSTPFATRDKAIWRVPHLEATSLDDLPDPDTTPYGVCFYVLSSFDEFSVLAYDAVAPAGSGCGRARCWTKGPRGVSYNGGPQAPGGVASLRVGAGADGKAKLSFVGKGPGLGLQAYQPSGLYIPGGELLVELHAGASCWSAQYVNFGEKPSIRETNRYRTKGGQ